MSPTSQREYMMQIEELREQLTAMTQDRDMLKRVVEDLGGKFAMSEDEVEQARRMT